MSDASTHLANWPEPRIERVQRWFAAIFSALLHLLMMLVLLYASTPTMTTSQSADAGGRVKVEFIGQPRQSDQPVPSTQNPPPSPATAQPSRAASRVISTLVEHAENPVPPNAATPSDTRSAQRNANRIEPPHPPQPQPPRAADAPEQSQAQTPTRSPPPSAQRRPETWTGRPPGLIAKDAAPENAGLANSAAVHTGRGRASDAGPSMELGGYLVYYDVLNEILLRDWKDQGIKELFIPLPGTKYHMICPLEIALKRGSGKCRALKPDSPEMQTIGDARKAVTMLRVYKQGELVWTGPGPYK